jgi:hypothetical protein
MLIKDSHTDTLCTWLSFILFRDFVGAEKIKDSHVQRVSVWLSFISIFLHHMLFLQYNDLAYDEEICL